jgi:hypothetical protein
MSPPSRTLTSTLATADRCAGDRIRRAPSRRVPSHPAPPRRSRGGRQRSGVRPRCAIASYRDRRGRPREIVTLPGAGKSLLVLDRDALTLGDRRLLAHLAADEPPENAEVVSRCFLDQARSARCACRRLTPSDLRAIPFADELDADERPDAAPAPETLHDDLGVPYRIACVLGRASLPELRWCSQAIDAYCARWEPLSVREAIARLERYEPIVTRTRRAIAAGRDSDDVSSAVLRAELVRVQQSPIVLNRSLRAAVVDAVERGQSMSEIAMRCGRIKRDARGNASGETSWLARRLGLLPEGGRREPTPWIHSDVLALIARDGLGLSPREVEAD